MEELEKNRIRTSATQIDLKMELFTYAKFRAVGILLTNLKNDADRIVPQTDIELMIANDEDGVNFVFFV